MRACARACVCGSVGVCVVLFVCLSACLCVLFRVHFCASTFISPSLVSGLETVFSEDDVMPSYLDDVTMQGTDAIRASLWQFPAPAKVPFLSLPAFTHSSVVKRRDRSPQ